MLPAGDQQAASSVLYTTNCKNSLVILRMGEIIARNMLSWLKLLIKLLLLHLVGCLYYCIYDARLHKHQTFSMIFTLNSNYCHKQLRPVACCNRDAVCFLWRKSWNIVYQLGQFVVSKVSMLATKLCTFYCMWSSRRSTQNYEFKIKTNNVAVSCFYYTMLTFGPLLLICGLYLTTQPVARTL